MATSYMHTYYYISTIKIITIFLLISVVIPTPRAQFTLQGVREVEDYNSLISCPLACMKIPKSPVLGRHGQTALISTCQRKLLSIPRALEVCLHFVFEHS